MNTKKKTVKVVVRKDKPKNDVVAAPVKVPTVKTETKVAVKPGVKTVPAKAAPKAPIKKAVVSKPKIDKAALDTAKKIATKVQEHGEALTKAGASKTGKQLVRGATKIMASIKKAEKPKVVSKTATKVKPKVNEPPKTTVTTRAHKALKNMGADLAGL